MASGGIPCCRPMSSSLRCVCLSRRAPVCTSGIYLPPSATVSCNRAGLGSSWEGCWLATHSQWPLWEPPLQKSPDCSLGGIKGLAPHPAQDKPGELSGLQGSLWGPLAAQRLCLSVLLPCFPSPCREVIRAALPGKPCSAAALSQRLIPGNLACDASISRAGVGSDLGGGLPDGPVG